MAPEHAAIAAMWAAMIGGTGWVARWVFGELKACREECRKDRTEATTAIQGLTTALNKTLEKGE